MKNRFTIMIVMLSLAGCDAGAENHVTTLMGDGFQQVAIVNNPELDEISGIQAGSEQDFFVHNDDGKSLLHVIDLNGRHVGEIDIKDAKNRNWEDISSIQTEDGRLLVLGDIGDNKGRHKSVRLYFVKEPQRDAEGHYPENLEWEHKLKVRYPDGPRDCEAMAYDPSSGQILFLTKRDRIPRLYGLEVEKALVMKEYELEFLGQVSTFRAPTKEDIFRSGKRSAWISQPTGMDISLDGKQAAVITYRSLYLWSREEDESWLDAFQKTPREVIGPPGYHDEAVTFGPDQKEVYVTTERVPTPLYRLVLPETEITEAKLPQ
jgi:hypothetical protein